MGRRYVPTREAADYLGITVNHLHKLTSNRDIPFIRLGRQLRFDIQDLDTWMRGRRVEAEA